MGPGVCLSTVTVLACIIAWLLIVMLLPRATTQGRRAGIADFAQIILILKYPWLPAVEQPCLGFVVLQHRRHCYDEDSGVWYIQVPRFV